jgi:hypothetical protein
MRATCSAPFIFGDLLIRTISGVSTNYEVSSLRPKLPVTSFVFGPNIAVGTQTLSIYVLSFIQATKFRTHTEQK